MAITIQSYTTARQNLLSNPFASESIVYVAQLVSDGYTFDTAHAVRSSVGNFIGTPIELTSKAVTTSGDYTYLDCADLDFITTQGTLDAAYCLIHLMNTGSPQPADALICCIDFNAGETESISGIISFNASGFIRILRDQ